jgi:hypothetical protein
MRSSAGSSARADVAESGEREPTGLLCGHHSMPADGNAAVGVLRVAIVDEIGASAGRMNEYAEALQLAAPKCELGLSRLGQGADLLEKRGWDDRASGVIEASYS